MFSFGRWEEKGDWTTPPAYLSLYLLWLSAQSGLILSSAQHTLFIPGSKLESAVDSGSALAPDFRLGF